MSKQFTDDKNKAIPPLTNPIATSGKTGKTTFFPKEGITKSTVGGTTYIVTSTYKERGEGLLDKLWRLIQNDTDY